MRQALEKFTLILFAFLLIVVFMSCGQKSTHQTQNNLSDSSNYIPIKDGLYKDVSGNLLFKTIDSSDPEKPLENYIDRVWSNSFENDTKKLYDVIDPNSFIALGSDYYKDKNYIYYFHTMSDGGSLRIIDGAVKDSFSVYEITSFARDNTNAYYRGSLMDGVDLSSFKPIIIEAEGVNIGWYARDKFNFYNGADIMTSEEIELLKSELDKK